MQATIIDQQLRNVLPPELRFLMALVGQALGHPAPPADQLPGLTPSEWERIPEIAAVHRVQPLAYQGLKTLSEPVPADVMRHMKAEAERCWMHSTMLGQELGRVSRLLADSGIPMAALKGPALGVQAYGSGAARTMRDLDVLICASDFARTRVVLEANGFVWEDPVSRLAPASQQLYLQHAADLAFRHVRLGYLLEIHLCAFLTPALLPIPVEELIATVQTILLNGMPVPTLSPWRHFLLVAAHGAKHGWWRLHWLADFAAFLGRYSDWSPNSPCEGKPPAQNQDRWEDVERLGLSRLLASAFRMSSLCFGTPLPSLSFSASERTIRPIVSYGVRSLVRGRPPATLAEKRGELLHYFHIRTGVAYFSDVLGFYWHITQEDIVRFPLPARLMLLYPALRPWLWMIRRLMPNGSGTALL